jgi:Flp pilus assembly protein TadB
MLEPRRRPGGIRAFHGVAMVAVVIVAAVITLVVFEFVVGFFIKIVELAVVVALVAGAIRLITRNARRRRL